MTARSIKAAARTDVGCVRTKNDDAFVECPDAGLWAVADGMGGYAHGRWAADVVVGSLSSLAADRDFLGDPRRIVPAIEAANAQIQAQVLARNEKMGATVAVLLCQQHRYSVCWVGDSRIYLIRQGDIHQLTHDHTQVQELVDGGLVEPDQAHDHPFAHVLARGVGAEAEVKVDVLDGTLLAGDRFVICSDGLTRVVEDDEILAAAQDGDPRLNCQALIDLALQRGAPDNVTTIVVAHEGS